MSIDLVRYLELVALIFYFCIHLFWAFLVFGFIKRNGIVSFVFQVLFSALILSLTVYLPLNFILHPVKELFSPLDVIYEMICFVFVLTAFILSCARVVSIYRITTKPPKQTRNSTR
jgi:hypothetical protein